MISKDIINKIVEVSVIEDVVGEVVHLKRKGSSYEGLCPFHDEKTPSFKVTPSKNIFKCFGCGKAGDSIAFVMEYQKTNYPGALRYLAKKYNIVIEETKLSLLEINKNNTRESLLRINTFANNYFIENLQKEEGKNIALTYFTHRGFSEATIKEFQLGYNPKVESHLYEELDKSSFQEDIIQQSGLVREKDARKFDFFSGRVMFPIHSTSGQILGFGGRILSNTKKIAKYFNSPETELYNKSNILYGLYYSQRHISKEDNCYLVEGYTDVISLYQKGIQNVVSASGTSLTKGQIKLIKRYTKNITVIFDGDSAGIKASIRGIDMLLENDMDVYVVGLNENEDPDSFAQKNSETELKQYFNANKQDFISFKTNLLIGDVINDPIKKSNVIHSILESISKIKDNLKRNIYMKKCAKDVDVSEQDLYLELEKILNNNSVQRFIYQEGEKELKPIVYIDETNTIEQAESYKSTFHQEIEIIRIILYHGKEKFYHKVKIENEEDRYDEISVEDFFHKRFKEDNIVMSFEDTKFIWNWYYEHNTKEDFDVDVIFEHFDNKFVEKLISNTSKSYNFSPNWKNRFDIHIITEAKRLNYSCEHAMLSLQLKITLTKIQNLEEQLKNDLPEEEEMKIINDIFIYTELKKIISSKIDRIILY